jgi:hypothetical protein
LEAVRSEKSVEDDEYAGSDDGKRIVMSRVAVPGFAPAFSSTLGYLSSSWPVAYLIATVIFGIGALIGASIYVSQPNPIGLKSRAFTIDRTAHLQHADGPFVGRITGAVDCRWVDPSKPAVAPQVSIGQRYCLATGVMEITYNTGAKVVLHGPATYQVESNNGGFLSVGELFGKVDVESAKGFSVRTPTAMVTDLGTEFGVIVSKDGDCEVHVIKGAVKADRIAQRDHGPALVTHEPPLTAGQAVRFSAADLSRVPTKMDAGCFKAMQTRLLRGQSRRLWPIVNKTLVAWVALANTDQRGAGVLSIAESPEFDGIVFGEIEAKKWMAGSHNYERTELNQSPLAVETAASTEFVQIAVVYQDWTVTLYRNGELYATYESSGRRFYNKHAVMLIGKRHPDIDMLKPPTLQGVVKEARLYNVSLTQSEVASLTPGEPSAIAPIGLWRFDDGTVRDATGHFPPGQLRGNAKIVDGQLILDGHDSYAFIPSAVDAKAAEEKPDTAPSGDSKDA